MSDHPDATAAPLVLALDTSTVVNVGLARGAEVLAQASVSDRLAHVEQLMPLVRHVLDEAGCRIADLDLIVVGLGPGPFTGLRVGVVTARVLASVTKAAIHGICSLDVIAAQFAAEGPAGDFVAVTDARRKEVYWARYAGDGIRIDGPRVSDPGELPALPAVGPAADLYADRLSAVLGPRVLDPGALAMIGPRLPSAGTEPLYLRRPDASEPTRGKSVLLTRPAERPQ